MRQEYKAKEEECTAAELMAKMAATRELHQKGSVKMRERDRIGIRRREGRGQ